MCVLFCTTKTNNKHTFLPSAQRRQVQFSKPNTFSFYSILLFTLGPGQMGFLLFTDLMRINSSTCTVVSLARLAHADVTARAGLRAAEIFY